MPAVRSGPVGGSSSSAIAASPAERHPDGAYTDLKPASCQPQPVPVQTMAPPTPPSGALLDELLHLLDSRPQTPAFKDPTSVSPPPSHGMQGSQRRIQQTAVRPFL